MADLNLDPEFERTVEPLVASYRAAVPGMFPPPPLVKVRSGARRRAVFPTVAYSTAAVVLVATGVGFAVWLGLGRSTPPPGGEPTISAPPRPTTVPSPTRPVTTSPSRPPSTPTAPPPDPVDLTTVDWSRATIVLPVPHKDEYRPCSGGKVRLRDGDGVVGDVRVKTRHLVTDDVTGDARADAVLAVNCEGPGDSGDGSGHLMVVTDRGDGSLTGLPYFGPSGENYQQARVRRGDVVATVTQRYVVGTVAPNQQRTYHWDGFRWIQVAGPTAFPAAR